MDENETTLDYEFACGGGGGVVTQIVISSVYVGVYLLTCVID